MGAQDPVFGQQLAGLAMAGFIHMLLHAVAIVVVATAQDVSQSNLRGSNNSNALGETAQSMDNGSMSVEIPDVDSGFDAAGPYDEEPNDEEAEHPRPINETWVHAYNAARNGNETLESSWGSEFCTSHRTGYFCDGTSRIRCCKQGWGYVKCGSTVHSRTCGWNGGNSGRGGWPSGYWSTWHPHDGWHRSSYCESVHVGFFCYQHHKVHCCYDHGWYVDCSTRSETRTWC